jgi:hypothetical protein
MFELFTSSKWIAASRTQIKRKNKNNSLFSFKLYQDHIFLNIFKNRHFQDHEENGFITKMNLINIGRDTQRWIELN